MAECGTNQFFSKKAYEISYALFRMAAVVRRPSFADAMESRGLSLLDAAVGGDRERAKIVTRGIEYLLRFGADVGVLNSANVEIVARELTAFNSAIAELEKSANVLPIAELGDVFSKLSLPVTQAQNRGSSKTPGGNKQGESQFIGEQEGAAAHEELHEELANSSNGNGKHSVIKSAMRQSAILERIRQNGSLPDGKAGCRLKGIQEFLPEISERTLRYDVQNLIERGLIERIGSGGPATYYRAKTENTAVTFGGEQTL